MVPSICPLETLHNSLSLKQVDEFLTFIAAPLSDVLPETPTDASSPSTCFGGRKISLNTFTTTKILPTPIPHSSDRQMQEKPVLSSSGPSSNVSSAGPSSPSESLPPFTGNEAGTPQQDEDLQTKCQPPS